MILKCLTWGQIGPSAHGKVINIYMYRRFSCKNENRNKKPFLIISKSGWTAIQLKGMQGKKYLLKENKFMCISKNLICIRHKKPNKYHHCFFFSNFCRIFSQFSLSSWPFVIFLSFFFVTLSFLLVLFLLQLIPLIMVKTLYDSFFSYSIKPKIHNPPNQKSQFFPLSKRKHKVKSKNTAVAAMSWFSHPCKDQKSL